MQMAWKFSPVLCVESSLEASGDSFETVAFNLGFLNALGISTLKKIFLKIAWVLVFMPTVPDLEWLPYFL